MDSAANVAIIAFFGFASLALVIALSIVALCLRKGVRIKAKTALLEAEVTCDTQ